MNHSVASVDSSTLIGPGSKAPRYELTPRESEQGNAAHAKPKCADTGGSKYRISDLDAYQTVPIERVAATD